MLVNSYWNEQRRSGCKITDMTVNSRKSDFELD